MKTKQQVIKQLENIIKERDAYVALRDAHNVLYRLFLLSGVEVYDETDHSAAAFKYGEFITECHIDFNRVRSLYVDYYGDELPVW